MINSGKRGGRRGSNIIEFSLVVPWYMFLFAAVFDFGICCYGLIAAQNAARVGAVYCATNAGTASDSTTACSYALDQLRSLPNVGSAVTGCSGGSPVTVTAASVTGPDNSPASATSVSVTYVTPSLIPVPGVFAGSLSITRTVVMRMRG